MDTIERPQKKTRAIYTRILDVEEDEISGKIYTDQTGGFPVISSKGNRYIMVMLEYDSNYIFQNNAQSNNSRNLTCASTFNGSS